MTDLESITNYDSDDPFLQRPAVSRGLSVCDFNNDGKLDCLTTSMSSEAKLYLNLHSQSGNWIGFSATDPSQGGRHAYGAKIELKLGERTLTRSVQTDGSYLSTRDPRVHFGLGQADQIDSVKVTWPDQTVEQFETIEIGSYVELRRGEGTEVLAITQ